MSVSVRASKAPMLIACPSSIAEVRGNVEVNEVGNASKLGSLCHKAVEDYLRDGKWDEDYTRAKCDVLSLDYSEADGLIRRAVRLWDSLGFSYDNMLIEHSMAHDNLTGKPDIVMYSVEDGVATAHVVDWKFGRYLSDAYNQVAQYAYLTKQYLLRESIAREVDKIHASVFYVRMNKDKSWAFSDLHLEAWREQIDEALEQSGRVYCPGDSCTFCPSRFTCEPRRDWVTACIEDVSRSGISADYSAYKVAKSAVDKYKAALDSLLDTGNEFVTDDGKKLVRKFYSSESVIPKRAVPVLRSMGLSAEDIVSSVNITKSALKDMVKDLASKGNMGITEKLVFDTLRENDCMTYKQQKRTELVDDSE